ncbi:MAG: hypothetical protein GQ522_03105, partial [Deltaproteobacteria bacterium]|nr:hypothetical protein [Deltaproteobacteria bacterium]
MEEEKSKITAPQDGSVEEKRVRPTVIRRRRKVAAAEPKAEEEAPKKEAVPEEVKEAAGAEVGAVKEEKRGEETKEAVKVEGKPQEKGEGVKVEAVEEQGKVTPAESPLPAATMPAKDKKGMKGLMLSKEVTEFPKARPEKKRIAHKKSVFGRDQLYAERGARRKKFHPSAPGRKLKKTEITVPKAAKK